MLTEIKTEEGVWTPVPSIEDEVISHVERPPFTLPSMKTPVPAFLYTAQHKVKLSIKLIWLLIMNAYNPVVI